METGKLSPSTLERIAFSLLNLLRRGTQDRAATGASWGIATAGLATCIGLAAGLAAVTFRWLLSLLGELFFGKVAPHLFPLGAYHLALIPALGALVGGVMVAFLARETRGAGVTDVMEAVLSQGSRIRLRVAGVKLAGTSLVIGSGGSGGIEGPAIQIGGALGSAVGEWARLSEERLPVALAAGVSAAIAATFNTPVAGVLFAHEVILGRVSLESLAVVGLSAGVARGVAQLAFGGGPMLGAHSFTLVHWAELPLYLALACAAAVVGVLFTRTFDRFDVTFSRWSLPECLKPAVGGLAVGAIALAFPQVLGLGYGTIEDSLGGRLPVLLMAALVALKLVATSFSVGSGAPGGLIGPSIYLGAVLGGSLGVLFHNLLPQFTAPSGAYALVGMAAVLAATFHAPFAAAFTSLELTGDRELLLPLLAAALASSYLARRITPYTIYGLGLVRRGIDPRRRPPLPGR